MLPVLNKCAHITPLTTKEASEIVSGMERAHDVETVLKLLGSTPVALARVTYNYGDLIVDDGTFKLPGMQRPLNRQTKVASCDRCGELQKNFDRDNPVPLLLNLDKQLEVFRIYTDVHGDAHGYRAVPVAHRKQGELIGLFENLRPPKYSPKYGSFYVSAGSRNVHLVLPLKDDTSTLVDRARLNEAFPHGDKETVHDTAKLIDVDEYGLPTKYDASPKPKPYKLDGIASDWRIIRTVIGEPKWKSSLLMILVNRDSVLEMTDTALELFKTGFFQLQEALAAFTAEGPTHGTDTDIFMNVDTASVPTVWNHLAACIEGNGFVHKPVVEDDSKGPWREMFDAISKRDSVEHEIKDLKYVPLIIEPSKLDCPTDKAFVSFNHLLIPQSLFLTARDNVHWKDNEKFRSRLRTRDIDELAQEYPHVDRKTAEERISELEKNKKECWPDADKKSIFGGLTRIVAGHNEAKLSRGTCLKEFMTVRYRKPVSNVRRTGATTV